MHFNIIELEKRLKKLELLRSSVNDATKKIELSRDIRSLKVMINYASRPKYKIVDEKLFDESMTIKNNETIQFFNKYASSIFGSLYCFSLGYRPRWRIIRDTKINDREYEKLLESFLATYDKRLLELYKWLKSEERIELNSKDYIVNNYASGLCIHLTSTDESYILSKWNNRLSTSSILPHELGHAFLLNGTNSTKSFINKNESIFFEAYSIFLEFIFFDFLRNTKYAKSAIREEYCKLDSFIALVDYQYDTILDLGDLTLNGEDLYTKDGKLANVYSTRLILSNILAMYFTDLYRNDKKNFMKEISRFFEMFGNVSDEEFLSHYNLETLTEGSKNVINTYERKL